MENRYRSGHMPAWGQYLPAVSNARLYWISSRYRPSAGRPVMKKRYRPGHMPSTGLVLTAGPDRNPSPHFDNKY